MAMVMILLGFQPSRGATSSVVASAIWASAPSSRRRQNSALLTYGIGTWPTTTLGSTGMAAARQMDSPYVVLRTDCALFDYLLRKGRFFCHWNYCNQRIILRHGFQRITFVPRKPWAMLTIDFIVVLRKSNK